MTDVANWLALLDAFRVENRAQETSNNIRHHAYDSDGACVYHRVFCCMICIDQGIARARYFRSTNFGAVAVREKYGTVRATGPGD